MGSWSRTFTPSPCQSIGCGSRDSYPSDPYNVTGRVKDLQFGHTAHRLRS